MTLRARKGTALIMPDVVVEQDGILLPDYLQRVGRPHGILQQIGSDDPDLISCLGQRVLIRTGVSFDYEGHHYLFCNINQILAVIDKDDNVRVICDDERCQWCKSRGEGNMMLDHDGYCIQCGLNRYGFHRRDKKLKVSDEEIERFGHTPKKLREMGAFTKPNTVGYVPPKRPTSDGKILSFAGQKKRSPL